MLDDYKAVMPLTWNSKYGIRYLYQPFLTAQLGVFGKHITEEQVGLFVQNIPSSFRLIEISLNSGNILSTPGGFAIHRSNYVLHLNSTYEELYKKYSENIQRNIKRSIQSGSVVQKNIDVEQLIGLAVQQMRTQNNESADNVNRFRKLYQFLSEKQMATTYGIRSAEGELLASCAFFFSHDRAYYILVGNHPAGRNTGASHALIDGFIKDNAGKKLVLDFEGSDIPTLAAFYRGFGAVNEPYPALRINRLPFYLKWMKR